jgi:hypothetical protein
MIAASRDSGVSTRPTVQLSIGREQVVRGLKTSTRATQYDLVLGFGMAGPTNPGLTKLALLEPLGTNQLQFSRHPQVENR